MGPTDEELVQAFQQGDFAAFDELVQRWERKIHGAVYRVLGNEEEARDIGQETFLRAYRALGGFKRESRFSSWLYQIALNLCRDRLRRRKLRQHLSLEELGDSVADLAVRSPAPSALELIEQRDLSRAVAAALEALPDEQREVIVLKEYQGLTFLEIAEVLGLPASTVKTRLYRGLGQLREQLESRGIRGAAAVPASLP